MRDRVPAARARLPLECRNEHAEAGPALRASLDVATAIDCLERALVLPRDAIVAAAWGAFAWRVGPRPEGMGFELVTVPGDGGAARSTFAIEPHEAASCAEHGMRVSRAGRA